MDIDRAISVLDALAQKTRLEVVRLLLAHEPQGLPSGEVARALNVPQNTMSAHLTKLNQAGLVHAERQSRFIIYRADREYLTTSLLGLVEYCRDVSKQSGSRVA